MRIEINGNTYEQITQAPKQQRGAHPIAQSKIALMSMIMTNMDAVYDNTYYRKLDKDIDIIHEFELIQQKKSNRSKWERDRITRIFNDNFKLITSDETK